MTIQRNLSSWVQGDTGREMVRRTIDEMDLRLTKLQQMISAMAQTAANGNGGGLTAKQQSDVLALVAGRSSAVIGLEQVDPLVVGLPTNSGTVTNVSITGDAGNGLNVAGSPITSSGTIAITFGATINVATSYKVAGVKVIGAQGAAVADVASADATDLPSVITLANEMKAQVNTAFARLRAATGHGLWA